MRNYHVRNVKQTNYEIFIIIIDQKRQIGHQKCAQWLFDQLNFIKFLYTQADLTRILWYFDLTVTFFGVFVKFISW